MEHLFLDPDIRDWVVLPMVLMLILVGMGRHYVQILIKSDSKLDAQMIRLQNTAGRAQRLRANGGYISIDAFNARKTMFLKKKTGLLKEKVPGPPNPLANPMGMMDMMKGNMTFMLPNIVMMAFVSYFFAGFILVKLPFPLPSSRFKVMLQRGVDLSTLDVSYVSSLSWYFLVTFGLRGVYRLILGEESDSVDDTKMMQMQMGMGAGANMGFDASAVFKNEKEMLLLTKHESVIEKVERELLGDAYPGGDIDLLDMSKMGKAGANDKRSSGRRG